MKKNHLENIEDLLTQPSTSIGHSSSLNLNNENVSPNRNCGKPADEHDISRIQLKLTYIGLLDEAGEVAKCTGNVQQSIQKITDIYDQADRLFDHIKDVTELFLDAKLLHSTSSILELTAENLDDGDDHFNLYFVAEKFRSKALNVDGEPKWSVLSPLTPHVVHDYTPLWTPFLGSFTYNAEVDSNLAQERVRKRVLRDQTTEKKEPEKVTSIAKTHCGTEEIVQAILVKLKKYYKQNQKKPINYFKFVIDPKSFSKTIENIFHVSFLANDGHISFDIIAGEPHIYPDSAKGNSMGNNSQRERVKKQSIIQMDMGMWEDLIDIYELKEAMI